MFLCRILWRLLSFCSRSTKRLRSRPRRKTRDSRLSNDSQLLVVNRPHTRLAFSWKGCNGHSLKDEEPDFQINLSCILIALTRLNLRFLRSLPFLSSTPKKVKTCLAVRDQHIAAMVTCMSYAIAPFCLLPDRNDILLRTVKPRRFHPLNREHTTLPQLLIRCAKVLRNYLIILSNLPFCCDVDIMHIVLNQSFGENPFSCFFCCTSDLALFSYKSRAFLLFTAEFWQCPRDIYSLSLLSSI